MTRALKVLSTFIELGKYHFYAMSERTLCYWTENVQAKMLLVPKMGRQVRSSENACV
jgi:hypothetical protein